MSSKATEFPLANVQIRSVALDNKSSINFPSVFPSISKFFTPILEEQIFLWFDFPLGNVALLRNCIQTNYFKCIEEQFLCVNKWAVERCMTAGWPSKTVIKWKKNKIKNKIKTWGHVSLKDTFTVIIWKQCLKLRVDCKYQFYLSNRLKKEWSMPSSSNSHFT